MDGGEKVSIEDGTIFVDAVSGSGDGGDKAAGPAPQAE